MAHLPIIDASEGKLCSLPSLTFYNKVVLLALSLDDEELVKSGHFEYLLDFVINVLHDHSTFSCLYTLQDADEDT